MNKSKEIKSLGLTSMLSILMAFVVYAVDVYGKDFNAVNGTLMFVFIYIAAICAIGIYRVKNDLTL